MKFKLRAEWILVGVGMTVRLWLAWSRAHWDHPDEWYQTLEMGQILRGVVGGETWGIYSQEVDLHLRNLSLPSVFALLFAAVARIAPGGMRAPLFAAQLLSVLWSFGMVAAIWRWARPHRYFAVALVAWSLLPFWAVENTKPSAENWALHAFFWSLFFLHGRSRLAWTVAGFAAALTVAFKLPAALLIAGLAWGIRSSALHTFKWRWVTSGFVLGIAAGGIPDWIFYGLPWESAVAYLQYNVFTSLGADAFGRQGPGVYLQYLSHHWLTYALPLSLWVARYLPRGLSFGLSRHTPWAAALLFYTVGHLFTAHKEGRFLVPTEGLLIFAAAVGTSLELNWTRRLKIVCGVLAALTFFVSGKIWRGDLKSLNGSFFELASLPVDHWDSVCGVVVSRRMHSFLLPQAALNPDHRPAFAMISSGGVVWDRVPQCGATDQILMQARIPTPPSGCQPAPLMSRDWLACRPEVVKLTAAEHPYVRSIAKVTRYPQLGQAGIPELLQRKRHPECTIVWCGSN